MVRGGEGDGGGLKTELWGQIFRKKSQMKVSIQMYVCKDLP